MATAAEPAVQGKECACRSRGCLLAVRLVGAAEGGDPGLPAPCSQLFPLHCLFWKPQDICSALGQTRRRSEEVDNQG